MKEMYTKPETMINEFKTTDIVTTSINPGIGEEVIPGDND